MSAERWAPIPGYPGYLASDHGRVASSRPWRGTASRILTPTPNQVSGYPMLSLSNGERFVKVYLHAVVMLAFVGNPEPGHEVRHLDGDPTNNRLSNLAYGTHTENEADKLRHGSHGMASRTHCKHGHEYTPENTSIWRNNGQPYRQCVTCANARRTRPDRKRVPA